MAAVQQQDQKQVAKPSLSPAHLVREGSEIDQLAITTVRQIVSDMMMNKQSFVASNLSIIPILTTLFGAFIRVSPQHSDWFNRDRFVLSSGHASAPFYAILHLMGFDIEMEDLQNYGKSPKTNAYPERSIKSGIEITVGPLGHGFASGVGFALAESYMAARFNKESFPIVDHNTYCVIGDGDVQEGIFFEAASIAGLHRLGKLICFYNSNDSASDCPATKFLVENVSKRFEALNWHVVEVNYGDTDVIALCDAVREAKSISNQPSLIIVKTTAGYMARKSTHYGLFGETEQKHMRTQTKSDNANWIYPDFVRDYFLGSSQRGSKLYSENMYMLRQYEAKYQMEFSQLQCFMKCTEEHKIFAEPRLPAQAISTQEYFASLLPDLLNSIPNLVVVSSDMFKFCGCSGLIEKQSIFLTADNQSGRLINVGSRESAMAAISIGLALNGLLPVVIQSLVYYGNMIASIRLAAMQRLPLLFIAANDHPLDSAELGSAHQPVEQLAMLRSMPFLNVLRPSDPAELIGCCRCAFLNFQNYTSVISISNRSSPNLPLSSIDNCLQGAYRIWSSAKRLTEATRGETQPVDQTTKPLIIVSSGSDVHDTIDIATRLPIPVDVVSMVSFRLFQNTPAAYQESVIPSNARVPVISVECASPFGWSIFTHAHVGLDRWGASGTTETLTRKLNWTREELLSRVQALIRP